jgi:hypothetical protein
MTVVLRNALISVLPTELYLRRKAYYKRKRRPGGTRERLLWCTPHRTTRRGTLGIKLKYPPMAIMIYRSIPEKGLTIKQPIALGKMSIQ